MLASTENKLIRVNFLLRFVIVAVLGAVPSIGAVTLAYRLSASIGPLELSLVVNIVTVAATSLLLAALPNRYRVVFGISLILYACLGYLWFAVNGHLVGIFFFMTCAHMVYLLRVSYTITSAKGLAESLRTQFKGGTITLLALTAYYVLFNSAFNLSNKHYPVLQYPVLYCGVLAVLLWAYILWTIEQRERLGHTINAKQMWVMLGLTVGLLAIFIPVLTSLLALILGVSGLAVILPFWFTKARLKFPWYQHSHSFIHVSPGKPWHHTNVIYTSYDAAVIGTYTLVIAGIIVAVFLTWFLFLRRYRTISKPEVRANEGTFIITNRERSKNTVEHNFVRTQNPIRNNVQAYLRDKIRNGQRIDTWRTVRDINQVDNDHGLNDLMDAYEAVRYDPNSKENNFYET